MKVYLSISLLIFSLIVSGCYYYDELPPDQNVWPVAHPTSVALDADRLMSMDSVIRTNPNEAVSSIVVIKEGQLVYENYYFGTDRSTLFDLGGIGNSISNIALGRAVDMGLILSTDDSLYKYLPEYAQEFEDDPLKKGITFEHIMTMKSGLSWNEFTSIFDGQENDIDQIIRSDNWVEYLITKPVDALPGRRFSHNRANPLLIAAAIESQYGNSYKTFLQDELFQDLGVNDFQISEFNGNANNAWGISMTTLDLAKLGYLYLNEGDWFGQEIISQEYAEASVDVQSSVDYTNNFGWMWWRYADTSNFLSALSQNDAFFAAGVGEERLYVIPHLDLVVAITGKNEQVDFTVTAPFLLRNYVLDAIQ
ncbi:MAG: serine hydrolase [Reichenbachiella sp.]|uniref:serine hydrolase domain-containing protein n=1 Tax=Reichenbachiella sp. TaxID=2184521 RepID=UPI003263E6A2